MATLGAVACTALGAAAARQQPGCSTSGRTGATPAAALVPASDLRMARRLLSRPSTQPRAAQHAAAPWQQRRRPPAAAGRPARRPPALSVVCEAAAAGQHTPPAHADYQAKAGDSAVLQRPLKSELLPEEIHNVFGYPRNLKDKYVLGSVLGAGSFGVVRECTDRRSGRRFAVKSINKVPKNARATPRYLLKIQTEVDAMQQLGGSLDAVFLQDVFEDDIAVHLVMELCEGGSVLDGLKDGEYSERQVAHIMRAVVRFIAQCHAKGLIYRDIKPDNFLLVNKASPRNPLLKFGEALGLGSPSSQDIDSPVKATDFGLSIRHRPEDPPLKSRSGTPAYMAPEVIQQSYDERCDIWSAGIMMYQLLTGKFPFWDNVRDCTLQQVWKSILTDKINWSAPALREVSAPAKDLLKQMLERNPAKRIRAAQALRHPWLTDAETSSALPLRSSVVQRLQRFATYGHLKQLVLRIIADDMATHPSTQKESQELIKGLTQLFDELDVNASGSVSMDELVSGLDRLGYDIRMDEMEHLMHRVDINHDGVIQLTEFVAGLVDWKQLQNDTQWGQWVQMAFDRLDQNGDGWLSLDEIMQQLPDDGSSDAERMLEARRMLREADTNGDGRISRDEFMELLMGTSLPDTLNQYDPRIKLNFQLDEALEEIQSFSLESDSSMAVDHSVDNMAAAIAASMGKQKGSSGSSGSGSGGSGSNSSTRSAAQRQRPERDSGGQA
ncbi:hypothetical protein ABPG75_000529 [Micractinium tetrahymenae]